HDHRPTVVLSLLDKIQLIATARTMFNFPKPSIGREGETLWRSMTHRPDFRQTKPRIAGRRLSFWCDMDHLAQVFVGLLRLHRNRIAGGTVAKSNEQCAVLRIDGDARTGLAHRSVSERRALKDDVDIRQRARVLIQRGTVDSLDARVGIND